MSTSEMITCAQALVAAGKGILAADESTGTIQKRFAAIDVESTGDSRRDYRELLFTTAGLGEFISGVILYDETIRQSAADGVALARQEKPDAVLMDIVMPGLNGFQATRQLTKDPETGHIPVIIVTTKDQETDKVWGTRQGAKDYLTKPVDESTLIKTLKTVLGS